MKLLMQLLNTFSEVFFKKPRPHPLSPGGAHLRVSAAVPLLRAGGGCAERRAVRSHVRPAGGGLQWIRVRGGNSQREVRT